MGGQSRRLPRPIRAVTATRQTVGANPTLRISDGPISTYATRGLHQELAALVVDESQNPLAAAEDAATERLDLVRGLLAVDDELTRAVRLHRS